MEVSIGGNRLGSGGKQDVHLKNFGRSNHDLSYIWKSTMSAGTLVPFMSEIALPGDTFDINLYADVMTHPTVGPLFGSYKLQLDVFQVPIRLYQAKLHMNLLGIGMDMSKVVLPTIQVAGLHPDYGKALDNQQINGSCILSYLGIRGVGIDSGHTGATVIRYFNAIPYLGYWEIYKQYYANKQEEIGAVIHKQFATGTTVTLATLYTGSQTYTLPIGNVPPSLNVQVKKISSIHINLSTGNAYRPERVIFDVITTGLDEAGLPYDIVTAYTMGQLFKEWNYTNGAWIGTVPHEGWTSFEIANLRVTAEEYTEQDVEPEITTFPLSNIDDMKIDILKHFSDSAFNISQISRIPYGLPMTFNSDASKYSQMFSQEGLALKTYQSDLFNNWISTEWIDGAGGINEITSVDTSGGSFTIDELNLRKKVYDMLNRIAISGGSYDDWLDAVYTHERHKPAESPIYLGGLIKNIVFQEIVSNAETINKDGEVNPLGSLAGRGRVGTKHKGGHIISKIDEPSVIMGIISITPIVDYSQGNKWDVNLKTLNDLHKPSLDEIGYQDLITDQMAWFDTETDIAGVTVFKSAGKQPAWINYMTNVNQVRGNFADENDQMYMTLNRRYSNTYDGANKRFSIKDLTTYIDPAKFNYIFANTRRDAQNFWVQVNVNLDARRKMSAKVIPNL